MVGTRGLLSPKDVETAIRRPDLHTPPTTLLCLEQTHNVGGGSVYPIETMQQIAEIARQHGLSLHLDGARLFNASLKPVLPLLSMRTYSIPCRFVCQKDSGASWLDHSCLMPNAFRNYDACEKSLAAECGRRVF